MDKGKAPPLRQQTETPKGKNFTYILPRPCAPVKYCSAQLPGYPSWGCWECCGFDNETIGFVLGMIWAAIFMAAWIASLAAGGWLE